MWQRIRLESGLLDSGAVRGEMRELLERRRGGNVDSGSFVLEGVATRKSSLLEWGEGVMCESAGACRWLPPESSRRPRRGPVFFDSLVGPIHPAAPADTEALSGYSGHAPGTEYRPTGRPCAKKMQERRKRGEMRATMFGFAKWQDEVKKRVCSIRIRKPLYRERRESIWERDAKYTVPKVRK